MGCMKTACEFTHTEHLMRVHADRAVSQESTSYGNTDHAAVSFGATEQEHFLSSMFISELVQTELKKHDVSREIH